MGVKYQDSLTDGRERAVEVRLHKQGYGGSASEVKLGGEGVRREWEGSDSDELAPLRPSTVHVHLHPSEEAVMQEMRSSSADWYVEVLVEGSVDVKGIYRPGLLDRSDDKFLDESFELVFNDGLGQLKSIDLVEADDDYLGRKSIIYWVCRCLNKLPDFLQLEVAAATRWYTPSMSSATPLLQEKVNENRWVEDGDSLSCWDVLKDMVGEKLAFLCQSENQWRLHQRALYEPGTAFDQEVYDLAAFTIQSQTPPHLRTESHDPSTSFSDTYIERLSGARLGERGSRASVEVEYNFGSLDNVLPDLISGRRQWTAEGEVFEVTPPNLGPTDHDGYLTMPDVKLEESKTVREMLSSEEDPNGNVDSYNPPYFRIKKPIRIDADGSGLSLSLTAQNRVIRNVTNSDRFVSLAYYEVELDGDDGTTYWLKRDVDADQESYTYLDPSWETSKALVANQMTVPPRSSGQGVAVATSTEEVEAPPLPADGEVMVRLWGEVITIPGNLSDYRSLVYRILGVTMRATASGAASRTTLVETSSLEPDQETYERSVRHGTGPTSSSHGATFVSGTLADNWAVGTGHSSGVPADELLGRRVLQQLAGRREELEREVLPIIVHPTDVVDLGGTRYLPASLTRQYKRGTTEVELVEVFDAGVATTTTVTVGDGSGSNSGGGGGGSGSSGGDGASNWRDIEGKPDEIFSRSGEGGTVTLGQSDIAGALGHDPGLSEGVKTSVREQPAASDEALPTEEAVREEIATVDDDATLIAKELVQTQAEIDGLDAVTVRRARSITAKGQVNRVEVDASETVDGALTKDLVLAFGAPQDLHSGADFEVATLAAGSPNTPTNGQIALGAQADETYEAVRADRKVTITGTTNQVGVNGRSGMLTQDVIVTLNAPQDLHTTADFEVGTLAAGTPSNTPGDVNAAGTIFSETEVRIQSPSKTPKLLNVAGGAFFDSEINSDEGIVADSFNVSTLGGSGYVLRRLGDDSTQLYSDEIVANTFRVAEFLVNQITFSASEAISAGFVARAPITDNGGGEYEVGADTNPTVAADDLVRAKRFTDGSHDSKARVVSVSRNGSDSTVTLQLVDDSNNDVTASASNDAPEDGFQYARIGNLSDPNRQNLIYLTASDASNPRIDFFEGVSEFSEFGASALTTRVGNLSGLSSAYSNKMGIFSRVGRFTDDVIIGDLEAGTNASVSGQYLKYDGTDIEIMTASGDVETLITTNVSDISQNEGNISQNESDIADNEADLLLLARRIVQESESRAGIALDVGQNSASIEANATVIGDDGLFSQSTLSLHARDTESRFKASVQYTDNNNDVGGRASISLLAGPGGSDAILAGENILLDGDTEVQGGFTVSDTNIETGYRVTLRQPTEPGDGDVTGRDLKDGDIWIDTDDGDTVHTYDGQSGAFQRTHSESVVIRQDSKPSSRPSGNNLQQGDIWIDTDGGDTVYTYDGTDFSAVDNGNITIRQNSEPSTRPGGETLVKGDIWIDTDADDTVYTYDGSTWVETTSQNVVIRQASEPSSRPSGNDLEKGDVWIDTDDGDTVYTYDGSSFTPADNGNVTIRQPSTPSQRSSGAPLIEGDVWIDTDAGDTVYTYDGSSFQRVQSDNVVIRSDTTPSERPSGNNLQEGDVWIETDEGNAVHTYNGSSFERTEGDGNVTIRQASAPSQRPSGEDLQEGDTWIDTDDGNTTYTYDGSQWVKTEADLRVQADQNAADVKLLAKRVTQEQETRSGIELNVGENSADIEANATAIGDDGLFSQSTLSLHASETETRFESSVQYTDNNNDVDSRASISLLAGPGGSEAILAGENILLDGDTVVQGAFTVDDGTAGGWTVNQNDIRSLPTQSNAGLLLSTDLGMGRFQDYGASLRATSDVTDPTVGPFVELFVEDDGNFGLYAEDGSGSPVLGLGASPAGSNRPGDFFIQGDLLIDGSVTATEIATDTVTATEIDVEDFWATDATVKNSLTMGSSGEITDDASPINYRIDSDGVDFRATDSTRASATEVAWLEPDLTGTVRGEIYAHNQEMNIASYRFGSANYVRTTLTAYDRPKSQDPKEYARIELNAEQYLDNEVNLVITDSGEFNIRNADVGGVVFDFDPFDWYMGIKKVYNFDSVPGGSPPSPSNGLRLYAKDELTGNDVPYLWFITENGTQYRIDATPIT